MTVALNLNSLFVGIILVPIIGNAAEHSTAISMALKNKMNISMEIALGSSLQIVLFVAPILVIMSLFLTPMDIIFDTFELVSLIASVLIANKVSQDGESNWLEGALLIIVYILIAISFFII